jgi:hypothetical protein
LLRQSRDFKDDTACPKRKTDLERSVSLLTPHHPSDHMQIVVLRLPLKSSLFAI